MRGADQPPRRQGQQMADADYDFGGYDYEEAEDHAAPAARVSGGVLRRYVNLAGALASLGIVVGFGVWGYNLAVRDVQGVPVIQALEGPMRVAPTDPGGEVIDYQGLAVNDVAALGSATPMPDRLVLAPRPTDLSAEDVAGLIGTDVGPDLLAAPAVATVGAESPILAADPKAESASPTEVAIDAALAEALGEVPGDLAEEPVLDAPDVDLAMEPLPEGGLAVSPRPKPRPAREAAAAATSTAVAAVEIDPATIPVGTRLVQFGAFDTEDEARAEWVRLEGLFGEVMAGKGIVLQPAESGGRTFYRLRAHGFEDEDDARRFCSAFAAQGTICIPVPQR